MTRLLPLLLLGACTVSEEALPSTYGRAVCSRLAECERSFYEQRYDSRRACVDEWAELVDGVLDAADLLGQTYDPAGGYDCVQSIRNASCAEFTSVAEDCDPFE